jgi:hypothetical protein
MNRRILLATPLIATLAGTAAVSSADPPPTGVLTEVCNIATQPYSPNEYCQALTPGVPPDPTDYAVQQAQSVADYVTSGTAEQSARGTADWLFYGTQDECVYHGRPVPVEACALIPTKAPIPR